MSRAEPLLELMQARRRRRVAGAALAEELGGSLPTLSRDIASLQAQGTLPKDWPRAEGFEG